MDSEFNIGDYVRFENKLYIVKSILPMNFNIQNDEMVYGLVPIEKPNKIEQLLVRESSLQKADPAIPVRKL